MSPTEILELAADLATGRPTANQAVAAALAFVSCYGDANKILCDALAPTPGITLCRCGSPAKVAETIRRAAHQAGQGLAA